MKTSRLHKGIFAVVSALFFLYMLTLIFPFVWMLLNSLKTNMDFFKDIWSLPEKPLLSNYVNVWDQMNLLVYFGNSIKLTLLGTLASILTASMASYVIAKYKFKLSKLLYTMAIVVMLIMQLGKLMGGSFERIVALSNAKATEFTTTIPVLVYKWFQGNKFSESTALGLFQSVIGVILVIASDRVAKKLGEDGLL